MSEAVHRDRMAARYLMQWVSARRLDEDEATRILSRHRHEATRAISAQVEELRDVLREIVDQSGTVGVDGWHCEPIHGDEIAKARTLLAKHKETGA